MTTTAPLRSVSSGCCSQENCAGCGSCWRTCGTFLFNRQAGTYAGRTPKSWCEILSFYALFYGVLAGFFALLLFVFRLTLDPAQPKWLDIIGNSPGLGARPSPKDFRSHLIHFEPTKILDVMEGDQNSYHVKELTDFLKLYTPENQRGDNVLSCSSNVHPAPGDNKVCRFDVDPMRPEPCRANNNGFGYGIGQPCLLLKVNRIFGWKPVGYSPDDVPLDLIHGLANFTHSDGRPLSLTFQPDQIYFTCKPTRSGVTIGAMTIHPPSIPSYFYPYHNQPGYRSPFVFVQFRELPKNVSIEITCKVWAKNIPITDGSGQIRVHFKIIS